MRGRDGVVNRHRRIVDRCHAQGQCGGVRATSPVTDGVRDHRDGPRVVGHRSKAVAAVAIDRDVSHPRDGDRAAHRLRPRHSGYGVPRDAGRSSVYVCIVDQQARRRTDHQRHVFCHACRLISIQRRIVDASDRERNRGARSGACGIAYNVGKGLGDHLPRSKGISGRAIGAVAVRAISIESQRTVSGTQCAADGTSGGAKGDVTNGPSVTSVHIGIIGKHSDRRRRSQRCIFCNTTCINHCNRRIIGSLNGNRQRGAGSRPFRVTHCVSKSVC